MLFNFLRTFNSPKNLGVRSVIGLLRSLAANSGVYATASRNRAPCLAAFKLSFGICNNVDLVNFQHAQHDVHSHSHSRDGRVARIKHPLSSIPRNVCVGFV